MREISVIIPFYNDAKSCIQLVNNYVNGFKELDISYEFIIVNDCSNENELSTLKQGLISLSDIFIYSLTKNFGQYGSLAFGISKSNGKKLLITDQDILDLKTQDLIQLLKRSSDFDLQYIYQEESQRGIIRKIFSSLWHLFIVLNTRKNSDLENPLPFRLIDSTLKNSLIDNNYTITTLDIALIKYAQNISFYKIDAENPLEIKIKSEYSIKMLFKVGVYSIISIINDMKAILLTTLLFVSLYFWFSTYSLTLPITLFSVSIGIFGIAWLISKEQSYKEQVKQISKCVEK